MIKDIWYQPCIIPEAGPYGNRASAYKEWFQKEWIIRFQSRYDEVMPYE